MSEEEKSPDKDVVLPKVVPKPVVIAATKAAAAPAAPAGPPPPAILPDDVPAQVRPEDFLPYFQYPGAAPRGRGAEAPPAPPLPVSTATYIQSE
jgi:hypothetical protein